MIQEEMGRDAFTHQASVHVGKHGQDSLDFTTINRGAEVLQRQHAGNGAFRHSHHLSPVVPIATFQYATPGSFIFRPGKAMPGEVSGNESTAFYGLTGWGI